MCDLFSIAHQWTHGSGVSLRWEKALRRVRLRTQPGRYHAPDSLPVLGISG